MEELMQSVYDQPELWSSSKFHFERGRVSIWVANGMSFCRPESGVSGAAFGFIDRWRWWRAYKWWCRNAPAAALAGEE